MRVQPANSIALADVRKHWRGVVSDPFFVHAVNQQMLSNAVVDIQRRNSPLLEEIHVAVKWLKRNSRFVITIG